MKQSNRNVVLFTASLGIFLVSINATLINIGLVTISNELHLELSTGQWVITGYLLALAAVIPLSGYLSTRFGLKRIFMLSIGLFTLCALLCSQTSDPTILVILRFMQGIGGGGVMPVGQTLALNPFKPHERATAATFANMPAFMAPIFGPILGGWLIDAFNWQALFLINVPIGLLTLVLAWKLIPQDNPEEGKSVRLDPVGLVLTLAGSLMLVYAFAQVNQIDPATQTAANPDGTAYGWSYWQFWGFASGGFLLLVILTFYELFFTTHPLLDLRLFKDYNFRISSIMVWCIFALLFGDLILLPVFFQQAHLPQLSAFESGLNMMPQGIGMLVGFTLGGKLFNWWGARLPVGIGMGFVCLGMWQLGRLTPTVDGLTLLPWTLITGLGFGLALLPVSTLALQHLSGAALAKGNSLYNATRQIFASLATTITTSLLVQFTASNVSELLTNANNISNSPLTNLVASQEILIITAQAGVTANNDLFSFMAIGSLFVLVLAFFLPSRRKLSKVELMEEEVEGMVAVATTYSPGKPV
jgi:EmrB/QacA subfamily drug resistance transporter